MGLENKKYKLGFTLVELIVVIAIIGIVSTIAIVALKSSNDKANDAKMISDLKNLEKAALFYKTDKDSFPVVPTTWSALANNFDGYLKAMATGTDPIDAFGKYAYCRNNNGKYYYACGRGFKTNVGSSPQGNYKGFSGSAWSGATGSCITDAASTTVSRYIQYDPITNSNVATGYWWCLTNDPNANLNDLATHT